MKYRHLFFDLDRTLWDFDANADATLSEIFEVYSLQKLGIPSLRVFVDTYKTINDHLWAEYRQGNIEKDYLRTQRYLSTLEAFGVSDPGLASQIGDHYVEESPRKTQLIPDTMEVLDYLSGRYEMHIITNGFSEVQAVKLVQSDLKRYFDVVVTSELAGAKKPDPHVFEFSMQQAGATAGESLMIGDDLPVDILGAKAVGMDQVYFNPYTRSHQEEITYEIAALRELKSIL